MSGSLFTRRRFLVSMLALALLALAAYGASRAIRPDAFREAFSDVEWTWVVLSATVYAACQITSALVWHAGVHAGGLQGIGRGHTIGAHWVARGASEFVPAPVGEAARLATLRRHRVAREGGSWRIAGSIGAYRVVDGGVSLTVVALLALFMPLPPGAGGLRLVAVLAIVCAAVIGLVAWRLGPERLGPLVPARLRAAAEQVVGGAHLLASGRHFRAALALQVVTVVGRIASLAALLLAFGLPATAAPFVYCLTTLAAFIAISPGGLGVREAAVVPALVLGYGLTVEVALAFSLAVQATALVVSVTGATVALGLLRRHGARAAVPVALPAATIAAAADEGANLEYASSSGENRA